ncbi:hypothetical protein [Photobacterium damselae]|uniref:capsular polysaccharide export protein, LipB/KpsS family n=1 Tax=Photobacterium damselae TaxID=38293 RepID=UPI0012AE9CB6|nr:hypothetical protein [Photobacterium damselae]
MNLLFIENRFKTLFWKAVAKRLKKRIPSLNVSWLIQNKSFSPKDNELSYIINYPKNDDVLIEDSIFFDELMAMDRGYYVFGNGAGHYKYYYKKIKEIILLCKPDFVIGESTLFHELIAIQVCKELNITYLTPSSCRYPLAKFSFYVNGSLDVYNYQDKDIKPDHYDLIDEIVNRKVVPDYMKKATGFRKIKIRANIFYNNYMVLKSWIEGERFNTPSPFKKILVGIKTKINRKLWDRRSIDIDNIYNWDNVVLYPLQMQPESNIDVWGYPFNDQADNLKRLHQVLPDDKVILIKPNPKSKYELNSKLMSLINNLSNVICVSHDTPMDILFNRVNTVYTVTGTIGLEAVLSGKKLITETNSKLIGYPNVYILDDEKILLAPTKYNAEHLISNLDGNSYSGIISDPIFSDYCMSEENVNNVANAFCDVFSKVKKNA